jgi:hypothetical protein
MYLDPKSHAAITGAPVSIGRRPGAPFRAFNGMLTGTILQIVPKRMIVQSWREYLEKRPAGMKVRSGQGKMK